MNRDANSARLRNQTLVRFRQNSARVDPLDEEHGDVDYGAPMRVVQWDEFIINMIRLPSRCARDIL